MDTIDVSPIEGNRPMSPLQIGIKSQGYRELEPVYPEYIPSEDDVFLAEEQPLPAAALPTTDSPGCIPDSDSDEDAKDDDDKDPEEDPTDYLADHDDKEEEEPFGDDADEEDEEQPRMMTMRRRSTQLWPTLFHLHLHSVSRLGYLSDPAADTVLH
nr:hypothetical protein [Tanacetum cinerariifolium]